jgi:hypothetical protein
MVPWSAIYNKQIWEGAVAGQVDNEGLDGSGIQIRQLRSTSAPTSSRRRGSPPPPYQLARVGSGLVRLATRLAAPSCSLRGLSSSCSRTLPTPPHAARLPDGSLCTMRRRLCIASLSSSGIYQIYLSFSFGLQLFSFFCGGPAVQF